MNKELQDRVWAALPKEYREEVKVIYSSVQYMMDMRASQIYANKLTLLEALFGKHNLTSDFCSSSAASAAPTKEPKFSVGDKVRVFGDGYYPRYHKGDTGTVIDINNHGQCYVMFRESQAWIYFECLEPCTEPEINTWSDLVKAGKAVTMFARISEIEQFSYRGDTPAERKALATQKIAQLMPYFGGKVTDEEWCKGETKKFAIMRYGCEVCVDSAFLAYEFIAFHTEAQADRFLRYNEDLVRAYYMLDDRKEDEK